MALPRDQGSVTQLFLTLSSVDRREVLYCLKHHRGVTDIEVLAEHLVDRLGLRYAHALDRLHQEVLPVLDEAEIVEFDPHTGQVVYRGGSMATDLIGVAADHDRRGD